MMMLRRKVAFFTLLLAQVTAFASLGEYNLQNRAPKLTRLVFYRAQLNSFCLVPAAENPDVIPAPYRGLPVGVGAEDALLDPSGNSIPACDQDEVGRMGILATNSYIVGPQVAEPLTAAVIIGGLAYGYYLTCTGSYLNRNIYREELAGTQPVDEWHRAQIQIYKGQIANTWASGFVCAPVTAINDFIAGFFE